MPATTCCPSRRPWSPPRRTAAAWSRTKSKVELQIAKERKLAEEMAQKLAGVVCRISAKVAEEDRLYGSVTVRDVIDSLAAQNVVVEKRMVLLSEPIKQLGTHKVPIRVYKGVEPEITLEIVAEG